MDSDSDSAEESVKQPLTEELVSASSDTQDSYSQPLPSNATDVASEVKCESQVCQSAPRQRSFLWHVALMLFAYFILRNYLLPALFPFVFNQSHAPSAALMSPQLWSDGDILTLTVQFNHQPKTLLFEKNDLVLGEFDDIFAVLKPRSEDQTDSGGITNYRGLQSFEASFSSLVPVRDGPLTITLSNNKLSEADPNKKISFIHPLISFQPGVQKKRAAEGADNVAGSIEGLFWYPEVHIQLVLKEGDVDTSSIPPFVRRHVKYSGRGRGVDVAPAHFPILFVNDFWNLRDSYLPVNPITKAKGFPLRITFSPISFTRFRMAAHMSEGLRLNEENYGLDGEEFKSIFANDTHPYLLILTVVVTLLHSIFDILAFKNDIEFWKSKGSSNGNRSSNSLEGLSLKSIGLNVIMQLIVFLYLLEEQTSWIIVASTGFGVILEAWKLTKAFDVTVSTRFPYIHFKNPSSYISQTKSFDDQAIQYLLWIVSPLLFAYTAYSYISSPPVRLYTFLLKACVGFIYAFGFVMMTPQLFINYKLKSVAHLPWKAFVYKALNTFIDDLFAFIIKMPTLHRIACLRDGKDYLFCIFFRLCFCLDVIFFVYLYQRYLYPVDKSRKNEFGQCAIDEDTANAVLETSKDSSFENLEQ